MTSEYQRRAKAIVRMSQGGYAKACVKMKSITKKRDGTWASGVKGTNYVKMINFTETWTKEIKEKVKAGIMKCYIIYG